MADEDFPSGFKCDFCNDLLYKPVVLPCGHICCFWCSFEDGESFTNSRCPVCRRLHYHFPKICGLMHKILDKLYPSAIARRATEVGELQSESMIVKSTRKLLVTDLECDSCKQLLYRPVVFHCGHVYCDPCVCGTVTPKDIKYRCLGCRAKHHPKGKPDVCQNLHQFLEGYFPVQYSARRDSFAHAQHQSPSPSQSSTANHESMASSLSPLNLLSDVACDYCGKRPIVGVRYRCKDCFSLDLCESCHEISSKPPASPGQLKQHNEDHQFEMIHPPSNHETEDEVASKEHDGKH